VLVSQGQNMAEAIRRIGVSEVTFLKSDMEPVGGIDPIASFADFVPGISALIDLNEAAKEWIGLVAYRLLGRSDALFPAP
jgi:hypothetical protein